MRHPLSPVGTRRTSRVKSQGLPCKSKHLDFVCSEDGCFKRWIAVCATRRWGAGTWVSSVSGQRLATNASAFHSSSLTRTGSQYHGCSSPRDSSHGSMKRDLHYVPLCGGRRICCQSPKNCILLALQCRAIGSRVLSNISTAD